MAARIFQKSRNAMQSGNAHAEDWVLEFESKQARRADPLTGWSGGADTQSQVIIRFPSAEAAVAYADKYGIHYHLVPPPQKKMRFQSYADNFK